MNKGFTPDDEQWKKIHEWEEKHTLKNHQRPRIDIRAQKRSIGPDYCYQFEYSPVGTLGTVICTECQLKAMRNSLGNEKIYKELCERYDAEFFFGEV